MLLSSPSTANDNLPFTVTHAFFEPFVWFEDGQSRGIYVDVLTEAFRRMQISIQFRNLPWKRAQDQVKKGEADGFVTLSTPQRLEYTTLVQEPVALANMGIFTYKNHPLFQDMKDIHSINDLKNYRLVTYIGDGWAEKNLAHLDIHMGAPDLRSVLSMLAAARADIFVQTAEVTLYNIKKRGLSGSLTVVPGVKLQSLEFQLMIGNRSRYRDLVPQINNKLFEMRKDGSLHSIYKKYR